MATADTAFPHNAWYVLATAVEIGAKPAARTVLGHSIVMFRISTGAVVALQNRCCHRSFPLAHGTVDGDTIVCGYHGLRYDASGRCVQVPMQKTVPPSVKVRSYVTRECGPFVWIWMGEGPAQPESLPHQDWMTSPEWDQVWAYLYVKGSYVHLHENLLDLSHLSYLHATTFGTPEYALAPVENHIQGTDIQVWREVECKLPAIYAEPLGWVGARAVRRSGSQFVSPALHINTGIFRNLDQAPAAEAALPSVKVAQLITPETHHTTHYWTLLARNFARGNEAMSAFMLKQQLAAFREDLFAIEEICELQTLEAANPFTEISLPTDKAGVLMRRYLRRLAESERVQAK